MRTHEERTNRIADLFCKIEPDSTAAPDDNDTTNNNEDDRQEPHE